MKLIKLKNLVFAVWATFVWTMQAHAAVGGTVSNIGSIFDGILEILNAISIAVIAIAFVFVGYQVAFNNKRFTDVMPIFIGALIVGAALQLSTFLIGDGTFLGTGTGGT